MLVLTIQATDQPQLPLTGCNSTDALPSVRLLRRKLFFNRSQITQKKDFKNHSFFNMSLKDEYLPFHPKS